MSIQLDDILVWAKNNQLMLGLIFSAIVGTMPDVLPKWREFPQWCWTWFHEASKTFLNFKRILPAGEAPPQPKLPEPPPPKPGPQLLNG